MTQTGMQPHTQALAAIGIMGLGHVGGALARALAPHAPVLACDPALADSATPAQLAAACDVVFVCVPTPARADGGADLSVVQAVLAQLADGAAAAGRTPLVVIRSTVPPGTTQALAQQHAPLPVLVCPEFLRQHAAADDLASATRVLLGLPAPMRDSPGGNAAVALLRPVWRLVSPQAALVVTDAATAELVKYATNAFLALKVTFANQLADACAVQGLDYATLAPLLALDPRIGPSHLAVPGHDGLRGFGGPCLPKDVAALLAALGPQLPLLREAVRWNDTVRSPLKDPIKDS